MNITKNQNPKDANVYLIGSGRSSLASAFYLEKDNISLRGTTALSEEFCRTLMGQVQEQRRFSTQPEIKTYRMKNIESDMSFHLI